MFITRSLSQSFWYSAYFSYGTGTKYLSYFPSLFVLLLQLTPSVENTEKEFLSKHSNFFILFS